MKRQSLLGALFVLCAATSMSLAQGMLRLNVGEDIPFLPYYARIAGEPSGGTEVYHDGTWAAIAFYCNPAEIRDDFNLLEFFAFGESAVVTPTVSGFMLVDSEAPDGPPRVASLHGNGAVPVWFVPWAELMDAMADDELTVAELEDLSLAGSLMKGTATVYNEELLPLKHITINAQGRLEDGKRFRFHAVGTEAGLQVIQIRMW
ncbi:MAG: hypothetical protein AB9869_18740 [Verrucomicrobiia bacterium]